MFTRGDFWTEMGFCEMIITELWLGPRRDAISAQSRTDSWKKCFRFAIHIVPEGLASLEVVTIKTDS